MSIFEFKEIDQDGLETLDAIAGANRFNKWMYDTIEPYCKGQILEIGSGIGNISKFFFEQKANIILSDIRTNYCDILTKKFKTYNTTVLQMDVTDPDFDTKWGSYFCQFDSIFALNVIEHILDDDLAIRNCKKLLKTNGNLIILVPAYQRLYNQFDKSLEHYRRYTTSSLKSLMLRNFSVVHSQYFNFIGVFGWLFSGSILRKQTIPEGQMKLYDLMVPLFKIIDKIVFNSVGLSAIAVGEKK
jgi:2-polyprenyl-3-methyl-5-hydroxy-6-metoxy-1,4-benzoquinol methylase